MDDTVDTKKAMQSIKNDNKDQKSVLEMSQKHHMASLITHKYRMIFYFVLEGMRNKTGLFCLIFRKTFPK